jgi:hypothetical protein
MPQHWDDERALGGCTDAQEDRMEIDKAKVDEFTLALLYLTTFKEKHGQLRAWKGHDWDVLNRLYESGYIDDPVSKAKSVILTDEGAERSKRLFEQHFMKG